MSTVSGDYIDNNWRAYANTNSNSSNTTTTTETQTSETVPSETYTYTPHAHCASCASGVKCASMTASGASGAFGASGASGTSDPSGIEYPSGWDPSLNENMVMDSSNSWEATHYSAQQEAYLNTDKASTEAVNDAAISTTIYFVQSGDTLWGIAKSYLGSGATNAEIQAYVKQIAAKNGITNPNYIVPNQRLIL